MKRLIMATVMAAGMVAASAQVKLEDVISGKYKAGYASQVQSLEDGERYAQLSEDKKHIYAYSYKTGEVTDTLFDASHTRTNTVDDIEGFQLVPGGKRLLVWRNRKRIFRHSFTADYYILDIRRRELLPLSDKGPEQAPVCSPDGHYIAYVREGNIWLYKAEFGTEVQVTRDGAVNRVLNGVPDWLYEEEFSCDRLMSFSADSKLLGFIRLDESEVPMFPMQLYLNSYTTWTPQGGDFTHGVAPAGKDLGDAGVVSVKYPMAGQQNARASVCTYDIFYKEVKTMQLPDLDEGDFYIPRIRWTQKEDELAIFRLNRSQNELTMYYANGRSTLSQTIYTEREKTYVDFENLDQWQWLESGDIVVLNEQDGWNHLYLYDHNGHKKRLLTPGEWDVTQVYGVSEEARTVYFQAADQQVRNRSICSATLDKGVVKRLSQEDGVHSARFSEGCRYYVDNYSSLTEPCHSVLRTAQGKMLRELKNNEPVKQDWAAQHAPQKEWIELTTERGDKLYGWMVKPENARGCPALLVQYSGPNSEEALNRWSIGWEYYLAEKGYVVVCVDGRGTAARGTAWRKCTYGKLGMLEAEDQVSVARWLGQQPEVDKDRIAIWGWSYGGYEVLCSMSADEKVFKAGIAVAPVTDWRFYDSAYGERFMNTPARNPNGYLECSPLEHVDRLSGKLLLCAGTGDDNVHFQNTMNYVHRLVEANKQFEMQVYPDENHYIHEGNSYKHLYDRMFNFLENNLKK